MGMFGLKLGTWIVTSKKDKRWNKSGRGYGLVTMGGTSDMQKWIEKCKKKYGQPPKDLEVSFWKD